MRRILKTTVHANVRMSEQIFCAGHYYNSLNIFKFVFHNICVFQELKAQIFYQTLSEWTVITKDLVHNTMTK